jgi:hypothetical protein
VIERPPSDFLPCDTELSGDVYEAPDERLLPFLRESRKKTAGPGLSRTPAELQGLFALRFFDSLDDVGVRLANRRQD